MTQLGDERRQALLVPTNVEAHHDDVGNVPGVDGATVDNLEAARFCQWVEWEIVLADKLPVDEGKARSATVYQGVRI